MNKEHLNELKVLRNEFVHGGHEFNPDIFAKKLEEIGIIVGPDDIPAVIQVLSSGSPGEGLNYAPKLVLEVIGRLLEGYEANMVCDPWAGLGAVIRTLQDTTCAKKALAFTRNQTEAALGKVLNPTAEWCVGDSLALLDSLTEEIDIVASVLPFGFRTSKSVMLRTADNNEVEIRDDYGHQLLVAAALRLHPEGIGLFVVAAKFFFSSSSVLRQFHKLGLGIQAALALPSGLFLPYSNISTYLVVVRRHPVGQMFVAQLSTDSKTNVRIAANLKEGKEGGSLELGRFVDPNSFKGLDSLRFVERLEEAERRFEAKVIRLGDIMTVIHLGRFGADFSFLKQENAVFIPLIGISDAVNSLEELKLKPQNYAQVVIDPSKSDARFVARFLSSDLGKEMREKNMTGNIPKMNKRTLRDLRIMVPDLQTQKRMLEVEAGLAATRNVLLGLQNELVDFHREIWSNPKSVDEVDQKARNLSDRISRNFHQYSDDQLDQWFETLPFPLASILRAWQAAPTKDFKTKYEYLLHFFQATAEFLAVILLSAYSSRQTLFDEQKKALGEAMKKQNLTFRRASFGTWKVVVEYFGKQTRILLNRDIDSRNLCADIFVDPLLVLPEMLARKELVDVFSTTNKMRNDWSGHGGVVGPTEARLRNEQLLEQLQKLREVMADTWIEIQVIRGLFCQLRHEVFENEVVVLMGSNSEFLKETRSMSECLDIEHLHLVRKGCSRGLKLLPLVQIGSSPVAAKNGCYFYNSIEPEGLRFISYHFAEKPEMIDESIDAASALEKLIESEPPN